MKRVEMRANAVAVLMGTALLFPMVALAQSYALETSGTGQGKIASAAGTDKSDVSVKAVAAKPAVASPQSQLVERAWGLQSGFGVDALGAWKQVPDCSKSRITIAVIDTGVDVNHEAIKGSLYNNPIESAGKPGIDDDKNGFVDDMHGWDFVKKSGQLSDSHGHGTHIAGIIAGSGAEFKGVCPGAKIMSLRYYDPNGSGEDNLRNTIKAIEYAVQMKVDIINYSGGGAEFASAEYGALKKAEEKGILVVAAAGNERNNADKVFYYPAAYPLNNILSVTAIDDKGKILASSNWGVKKVHVAAPGQSILSALPNGSYGMMTGTSQATAFVSGIAALLMTDNPSLKMNTVRALIEASAQKQPTLVGKTRTGARASAVKALELSKAKRSLTAKRSAPIQTTVHSRGVATGAPKN